MKKTELLCDISDREHKGRVTTSTIEVMFDHDQEDGRSKREVYFSTVKIEICEDCWNYMTQNRRYIYAYGAMGNNTYFLTK